MAYLRIPEGMFCINPSSLISILDIHTYTHPFYIKNAVCSDALSPQTVFPFIMLKMRTKEGGSYNYDYLVSASRKINMTLLILPK